MGMICLWGFSILAYIFGGGIVCSIFNLPSESMDKAMIYGLPSITVFFVALSIVKGIAKAIYTSKHMYQTKICQCANGKFVVWHYAIGRYGVDLENDGWEEWRWMPYGDRACIWEDPLGRRVQYHDTLEDAMKLKAEVDAMYAEKQKREEEAEMERAGFELVNKNVDTVKQLEYKPE